MPGPIGKRDAERRRRNKPAVATTTVNLDELIAGDVQIPVPPMRTEFVDEETGEVEYLETPEPIWHPQAMLIWESAKKSGQAIFMEPSDWSALYLMCEQVSRSLAPQPTVIGHDAEGAPIIRTLEVPMPGATLNAISKMMSSLMFTEGDRRRIKIELERKKQAEAAAEGKVVNIAQRRADAFKGA